MKRAIKKDTWNFFAVFNKVANGNDINLIRFNLEFPKILEEKLEYLWHQKLIKKRAELAESGIDSEINDYTDALGNETKALYVKDKPFLWPGQMIYLKSVQEIGSKVDLRVSQGSYKALVILDNLEIFNLYKSLSIEVPRPLGVSVFPITLDDKLVLTIRGKHASYPGKMWGIGGGLELVTKPITEELMGELEDEILITPQYYNKDKFLFGGILEDTITLKGSVDIVSWLPLNIEYWRLKEIFNSRDANYRSVDAVDITFAPAKEAELFEYLTETSQQSFIPTGYGGLILYGSKKFGEAWASQVLDKIRH